MYIQQQINLTSYGTCYAIKLIESQQKLKSFTKILQSMYPFLYLYKVFVNLYLSIVDIQLSPAYQVRYVTIATHTLYCYHP